MGVLETTFCPVCGKPYDVSLGECPVCARNRAAEQAKQAKQAAAQPRKGRKGGKKNKRIQARPPMVSRNEPEEATVLMDAEAIRRAEEEARRMAGNRAQPTASVSKPAQPADPAANAETIRFQPTESKSNPLEVTEAETIRFQPTKTGAAQTNTAQPAETSREPVVPPAQEYEEYEAYETPGVNKKLLGAVAALVVVLFLIVAGIGKALTGGTTSGSGGTAVPAATSVTEPEEKHEHKKKEKKDDSKQESDADSKQETDPADEPKKGDSSADVSTPAADEPTPAEQPDNGDNSSGKTDSGDKSDDAGKTDGGNTGENKDQGGQTAEDGDAGKQSGDNADTANTANAEEEVLEEQSAAV